MNNEPRPLVQFALTGFRWPYTCTRRQVEFPLTPIVIYMYMIHVCHISSYKNRCYELLV